MSEVQTNLTKKTRKKSKVKILLLFVLILFLTVGAAVTGYNYVIDSYRDSLNLPDIVIEEGNGVKVEIPMGSSTATIADILAKQGILKNKILFKILSKLNGYDGTYQSGTHLVDKTYNYNSVKGMDVLMRILSGRPLDNPTRKVRLLEGWTYRQIVEELYKEDPELKIRMIDKAKFDEVANNEVFDYKFLNGLPQRENRLEGYLFPDTYIFDTKGGEKKIINKMLQRFNEIFKPEYYVRVERLKTQLNLDVTVDMIVTVASLVEREAKLEEERDMIAGVIYNRLRSKDPSIRKLQVDATIQYILLNTTGATKEQLTLEDLEIDNPYNTYKYEGLPPGPICSPGKAAIEAALYPDMDSGYLFYVAKYDGTNGHYFSKTYNEHLKAKAKSEANWKKLKQP